MTVSELKDLLKSAWTIEQKIKSINERMEQAKDLAQKCTYSYNAVTSGSSRGSQVESGIVMAMTEKEKLSALLQKNVAARAKILAYCEMLPPSPMQVVLYKRYVNNLDWFKIGEALCYDYRHCHRLHNAALKKLCEIINANEAAA